MYVRKRECVYVCVKERESACVMYLCGRKSMRVWMKMCVYRIEIGERRKKLYINVYERERERGTEKMYA